MKKILLIFLLFASISFLKAQEIKVVQLINSDSLIGTVVNNERVRILFGNVQLIHEDIRIFCDKGIQYLQSNKAELEGNIKIIQGNQVLTTQKGFYFGNTKTAFGTKGITLYDGKITLKADSGEYFFDQKKAIFKGRVILYDDTTELKANILTYYTEEERAIAIGNVQVTQFENKIYSDTLDYFRKRRFSIARGNVIAFSTKDNLKIYSDYLENDENKKYTYVTGNPILIQIDTTSENKIDTLVISAEKMESYRDTSDIFFAIDSVKIWRNELSAVCDYAVYNKSEGKITTSTPNNFQPLFWYSENFSYGDSVEIFVDENKIKFVNIYENAFLISKDTVMENRFNQMNGNFIQLRFATDELSEKNKLKEVFIVGNALSIYFLYDENEPSGLNKSSSDSALIVIEENKVTEVKLFGSPEGEYHPEEKIAGKEKEFLLSGFKWIENRPKKENLLARRGNFLF
ncbi:MAG: OstA-like protein [Ignavibacteria bacterium]|nr:LPS export ABC transporter periplasmic protein LptC [Ignavibacteria bacterium]